MPSKHTEPLEAGYYYHIYNRSINKERLFFSGRNYEYFLRLYQAKVDPHLETFAYCLLYNHFHFLVYVRPEADLIKLQKGIQGLFISYTQAINKQQARYGSLLCKPYKKKKISNNNHLSRTIAYIHQNPQLHTKKVDFQHYQWSSYQTYISGTNSFIDTQTVLGWFGGKQEFIEFHNSIITTKLGDF